MERYTQKQLFHLKDESRLREIYDSIVSAARHGARSKVIWWKEDDNIEYLKECINWYFCMPKIGSYADHIVVSWDVSTLSSK